MDEDIRSGWWKDHASGRRYILVKDSTAIMISNVVAVMLTLSLPRLLVFIQLAVTYLTRRITRYFAEDEKNKDREMERLVPRDQNTQSQRRELQSPGSLPVQPSQAHVVDEFTREAENFIDIVNEAHAIENAAARIFRNYVIVGNDINVGVAAEDPLSILYAKAQLFLWNLRQQPWKTSTFLILYAFLFSIFLAYQIIAIFASRMIGPPIVRSASPHAGSWFPDKLDISYMSNTSIFPIANDLHTEITFRAVGYAERCYGHRSSSGDCDIFYTPRINYTQDHNATCPFQSDMCLEGPESAYELNTGFIDAKVLGVNYEHTCKFRLRHICAPLVADKRFIRSTPSNNPYLRIVEYFYGDGLGISGDNKTFGEVVMDPAKQLNVDIPRYIIREIKGDIFQRPGERSILHWVPELTVLDARVTLYFIRPVSLVYTKASFDPIFPATVISSSMLGGFPLYSTPHQHSTVMACAESVEIQHPYTFELWHPRYQNTSQLESPEWQIPGILPSLNIINMSYLQPELFDSRYVGMAEHFNAPRRIRNFYSSPLDPEQWKLETRKIFNTRLALLQYHVLGIAQGLGYDFPRARNLLREQGVNPAGIITFRHNEWKNLKVMELALFLSICVALWTTSIRIGNHFLLWWLLKELCTLLCQFLPWIAAKCNGVRDVNITRVVHMIEERLGISGRQHRD